MNIKKELGNRIREIRTAHSLTQEALAEKIGLSAKSLSQIELGNNFVSAETLNLLCQALDVTPKILFDFGFAEISQKEAIDLINLKLKNNPKLLKTIYKIVIASE